MVLACSLLGSKRSSRSHGREGLRAGVLSANPKAESLLLKTCFLQHKSLGHVDQGAKWLSPSVHGYNTKLGLSQECHNRRKLIHVTYYLTEET